MANISSKTPKGGQVGYQMVTALIKVLRPVQWIKNLSIFAALIFTSNLFHASSFNKILIGFISFCFITSATYIINDIFDAKMDRIHPTKRKRPIASGILPVWLAVIEAVFLILLSLLFAAKLDALFSYIIWGYLTLQILYSLGLKNVAILDILIIATGFVLRVYSGALVINAHLSVWFLLCVVSTALFLASGKRRAEFNLIGETPEVTRKSLTHYKRELLDSYVTMFGNAAWVSWALFTFFESPKASLDLWLFLAELSKTTTINKLLMITIPIVIFGIMRYEYLIFEGRSEAPEKVLLTDKALITTVIIWTGLIVWIFYGGVSA